MLAFNKKYWWISWYITAVRLEHLRDHGRQIKNKMRSIWHTLRHGPLVDWWIGPAQFTSSTLVSHDDSHEEEEFHCSNFQIPTADASKALFGRGCVSISSVIRSKISHLKQTEIIVVKLCGMVVWRNTWHLLFRIRRTRDRNSNVLMIPRKSRINTMH